MHTCTSTLNSWCYVIIGLFSTLALTIGSIDYSTTGTSTPGVSLQISIDYRNSRTSNDKLRIGIIGVGSALVSLTVFSTIIWILKSIFRKIRTQAVTDGCSDDVATVYMEIDDGSNHGDIQEQLGRTVIEEPETSPGDRTEERPELPERMTVVFTSDVDMLVSCTDKDSALSMGEWNLKHKIHEVEPPKQQQITN